VVLRGDHRVPGANSGRARKPTYGTTGLGLNAGRYRQIISSLPLCNTPCQRQARSGGMRAGRQDSFWAQNLSITKPHLSSSTTIFFSWHLGRGPAGHSHHQKDEAHILFFFPSLSDTIGSLGHPPLPRPNAEQESVPGEPGRVDPPTALPRTALPHIRTRRTFTEHNRVENTEPTTTRVRSTPHPHPHSFTTTAPGSQGCTPRARIEWWVWWVTELCSLSSAVPTSLSQGGRCGGWALCCWLLKGGTRTSRASTNCYSRLTPARPTI
jgi:hypothetical protein